MRQIRTLLLFCLLTVFYSYAIAQQPTNLPAYGVNTPVNYIRTYTATAPTTDAAALPGKSLLEVKEATQYFDGLGRPLQTVVKKGSLVTTDPNNIGDTAAAKDLVSPVLYDEFGREQYKFLPFAATTADGQFKTDPYVQQQSFMATKYASQGEANFYSQIVFEASPLNRVQESFAPGVSWAGTATQASEAGRHSIKSKYWINTAADEVRIWDVTDGTIGNGSSGGTTAAANLTFSSYQPGTTEYKATQSITFTDGFEAPAGANFRAYITTDPGTITGAITSTYASASTYPAGELYKNVIVDEQGKQVIEFKDKEGQVILKKVQLTATSDDGLGSSHDGWLCTYYIYDNRNHLRCVIQPEGVKAMTTANDWTLTELLMKEQCFRYEYDGRSRMIVKKVPGAAEIFMVYDVRDRMVMTQDGNLRTNDLWNYIQHDEQNRPKTTGIISSATNFTDHRAAAKTSTAYPEIPTGTKPLTETFYDDYDWLAAETASGLSASYDAGADGYLLPASNSQYPYAQTNTKDERTKGMVTGTKVNILGTPNYTYTLTIYDDKARPIQVKQKNHTGGIDIMTTQYSWSGQPLVMVNYQSKGGAGALTNTTITYNTYDALGRITKTSKKIANSSINSNTLSAEKIIATNRYDELGQLTNKTLGGGLETQNYEYNIRGWLLGVNRDYVKNSNTSNYFGFDLAYDKLNNLNGLAAYAQGLFNGNIAGMTWRGKTGTAEIRRYDFNYDAANRILKADFNQYTGGSFNKSAGIDFSSTMGDGQNAQTAYDYNGNILAMTQQGLLNSSSQTIDQLTYNYQPNSNRLAKVSEAATNTTAAQLGDFNDGANVDDDYSYDVNGNMVKDQNKNIQSISYNILNLPEQIAVTGKGTISYQYDAGGNKLSKTVAEGSSTKTTTYLGGMIFENNILQFVGMEEGRFRPSGNAFVADYFLKDHLGNVRMMVDEGGAVLEETSYYPFGLQMKGLGYENTSIVKNKKKFIEQELDDEMDLNWHSFKHRNQDPQIGRFVQLDPLASKYSSNTPYAYAENKVTIGFDLEGLELLPINSSWFRLHSTYKQQWLGVPGVAERQVRININNVPSSFKDKTGSLLFSASSVNVGPNGRIISNNSPPTFTQGNRLPSSPAWPWSQPNNPSRTSSTGGWRMGMNSLDENKSFADRAGAIANAPREISNFYTMANSMPVWNAYGDLSRNKLAFYTAVDYANKYESDIKDFMGSNYTSSFRDDLINFMVDGTLPNSGNIFKPDYGRDYLIMGYGTQILRLENVRIQEAIQSYQDWVNKYTQQLEREAREFQFRKEQ